MENGSSFYRILQVQPDASTEVIEASYKTLMHRLRRHPDLGGDPALAALINEAISTLRDSARREAYDRMLATRHAHVRPAAATLALASPTAPAPAESPATLEPRPPVQASKVVTMPVAANPRPVSRPLTHACMNCAFCGTRHSVRAAERNDARCANCRSPLHPVPPLPSPGKPIGRRAVDRIDWELPVDFVVASPLLGPLKATSEDLSIHGMRLIVPVRLRIGTCVRIACEFCDAVGEVTNVRPAADAPRGMWRVGLKFRTIAVRRTRGSLVSLKG